jgi:hypothetical protein
VGLLRGGLGTRPATTIRIGRHPLPPLPLAAIALVLLLANAWFLGWTLYEILVAGFAQTDWRIMRDGVIAAQPYTDTLYRWSPLLLGPLTVITALPFAAWVLLHVAAALALPTWPMRVVVLASWPFWQGTSNGNVMAFVLLAAAWALRGNRFAQLAFLAIALLIPRPLMLPVLVWLLWRTPALRLPFLAMLAAVVGLTLAVDPRWVTWLPKLAESGGDIASSYNVGPSRLIGAWWIPIGFVLATWLTLRGWVGTASVAISPYILPYYLLMAALDLGGPSRPQRPRANAATRAMARSAYGAGPPAPGD